MLLNATFLCSSFHFYLWLALLNQHDNELVRHCLTCLYSISCLYSGCATLINNGIISPLEQIICAEIKTNLVSDGKNENRKSKGFSYSLDLKVSATQILLNLYTFFPTLEKLNFVRIRKQLTLHEASEFTALLHRLFDCWQEVQPGRGALKNKVTQILQGLLANKKAEEFSIEDFDTRYARMCQLLAAVVFIWAFLERL